MAVIHTSRTASADEIVQEMDRRGTVIETLEVERDSLRARAEKAEAEVARLAAEVAALRVSLGQQTGDPAEPIGCPTPGACSCPASRADPAPPVQSSAQPAAERGVHEAVYAVLVRQCGTDTDRVVGHVLAAIERAAPPAAGSAAGKGEG